jgi:signal peptidase I
MTATSTFIVILGVAFVASLALQTACVRWGLRWANVADVSYMKAFGLLLLFVLASLAIGICAGVILAGVTLLWGLPIDPSERTLDLLANAAQFIASCLVIAVLYKTRIVRAAQAAIPFSVAAIGVTLAVVFLLRPFAYEAFAIPTNAMAPTILGNHWKAPCPRCGQLAYGSPLEPGMPFPPEGILMNCSAERRAVHVTDVPRKTFGGDRILVCKLIAPRRWDLIVFRFPADPRVNYVKRLVGLPNEQLAIHDGAVWINGEKLDPPIQLRGIHYSPTIEANGQVYSGPGSMPLKLGPDEYFVLGDFPEQSADSRMWEKGAPSYPPYAVPASHLVGIAINIYWPPGRWISFR